MKQIFTHAALVAAIAVIAAGPVAADPGHGKKNKHHDRDHYSRYSNCPPGLAKKNPPCVPPGQAKKYDIRYGTRVGDHLRIGNYTVIRDPRRYDLEQRRGWDYYRDNDSIYRVDRGTRRILAVMELIDAFSN
ncbi:hypothetical protein [Paracoccus litorisediminis]|uniref:Regulator RcnB of Ni and Co efflux n=1 Tax=Paracoccus litorisediminis TaxID=2006130 RepID=A0A844HQ95_9RHOB|nr:hypothetical protein [Paracoccus litorisediminis]MTH60325.1 hypothetical protein [Paracoccus litorisediminis]